MSRRSSALTVSHSWTQAAVQKFHKAVGRHSCPAIRRIRLLLALVWRGSPRSPRFFLPTVFPYARAFFGVVLSSPSALQKHCASLLVAGRPRFAGTPGFPSPLVSDDPPGPTQRPSINNKGRGPDETDPCRLQEARSKED